MQAHNDLGTRFPSNGKLLAFDIGTEAWLEWRRAGIGSSDAASAVGINRNKSPYVLWLEKLGLIPAQEQTGQMRRGHKLEPLVAEEFEIETGLFVPESTRQLMLQHPDEPWMRATLDGLVMEHPDDSVPLAIFEAKTSAEVHWSEWRYGVPEMYQVQVQHQMMVSGIPLAKVVLLNLDNLDLRWWDIEEDIAFQAVIQRGEKALWDLIQRQQPPDVDGWESTTEAMKEAYSPDRTTEDAVVLPDDVLALRKLYFRLDAQIKEAEEQREKLRQAFMSALGTHATGIDKRGETVATWPSFETSRLDQARLKKKHPEIFAEYQAKSSQRRLHIKPLEEN